MKTWYKRAIGLLQSIMLLRPVGATSAKNVHCRRNVYEFQNKPASR